MSNNTSLPSNLVSTSSIVSGATYASGAGAFFSQFGAAWNEVRSQVLKLETRQTYRQDGNPSYDAFIAGDMKRAIELIAESVAGDRELYASLRQRRVDFIRCRPVALPMSPYLKWEMKHYEANAGEGERIFCCDIAANESMFSQYALHDFMVFDDVLAFIHDYDESGEIRGGWKTTNADHISELQRLFCWIRGRSVPFDANAA